MENKMTPEQKAGMMAMMDGMKKKMIEGGGNPFGPPPAGQQGGNRPQGGKNRSVTQSITELTQRYTEVIHFDTIFAAVVTLFISADPICIFSLLF